jgi:glycerol kinase
VPGHLLAIETAVVWDRASGKPIPSAIAWQDRRTAGWRDAVRRTSAKG